MSVINLGNQYITFDYKHPAKGEDFNTLLREAIKPGVYKGGIITPTGGAEISIAPFVVYINVGDDKLCRVETRAAVNISVTEATPVIALTYTWANVSENWLDFNQRASGSAPLTNEIVLGECEFAGGVITGINYDDKTWGIQYDGTVNPDFNADQVDGCDVETTLSPTLNTRIPTSKAVADYYAGSNVWSLVGTEHIQTSKNTRVGGNLVANRGNIKPSCRGVPLLCQTLGLEYSTQYNTNPIDVGTNPHGVAFDGTHIWVVNSNSNNVSKIDISTNTVVATVTVGTYPRSVAFDGTHIWVCNYNSNNVSKIDISTNTVVATVTVGTNPHGVAFDGTHIWVVNSNSNNVSKILI